MDTDLKFHSSSFRSGHRAIPVRGLAAFVLCAAALSANAGTFTVTGTPYILGTVPSVTGNFTCGYIGNNTFNYAGTVGATASPFGPRNAADIATCQATFVWEFEWIGTPTETAPTSILGFVKGTGYSYAASEAQSFWNPSSHTGEGQVNDGPWSAWISQSSAANNGPDATDSRGHYSPYDMGILATGNGALERAIVINGVKRAKGKVTWTVNCGLAAYAHSTGGTAMMAGLNGSGAAGVNMNIKLYSLGGQLIP